MTSLNTSFEWDPRVPSLLAETLDARGFNRRAIARLGQGDVAEALGDFQQAVALDPNYAEAWNNSGLVRQMTGELRPSLADFDRALALRPQYAEALTNRARTREALGDQAGALADYDQALSCAKDGFAASVLHNRGTLKQDKGDRVGALADFDQALQIDPGHVATLVNRGVARKESGDLAGALADLDRALEMLPPEKAAPVYHKRGGVRVLQNDFQGAIADYDRALAQEPDNYLYYLSRGNARYHRRDPRVVVDYRMAFRLNLKGTVAEFVRVLAEDVKRDAEAVLDNCTKHLRISARDAMAYARRGLTLLLLGRDSEAAPDLARLVEIVPEAQVYLPRLIEQARSQRDRDA